MGRRQRPSPKQSRAFPAAWAWRVAAAAIVAAGAVLRLVGWWDDPSLWLDECKLAIGIAGRDLVGLATPLDHEQVAPLPYLWLTKLATMAFGLDERVLRVVSIAAGVALLVVFAMLAFRLLPRPAALVALALCAASPALLRYSNELKQYSLDALVTAAALLLLDGATPRRAAWVAPLTAFLSMVSPFVLPAALALCAWRSPRPLRTLLAIGAPAGILYAALYLLVYREVSTMPYMQLFWSGATLAPWHGWGNPRFAFQTVVGEMWLGATGGPVMLIAAGAVLLAGAVALVIRLRARAALVVGPIALVLGAALVGVYPLTPRLLLFAAPLLFVLVAEALVLVTRPLGRWSVVPILVLGAALVVPPARASLRAALAPSQEGPREVARAIVAGIQPGDTVYVGARTLQTWLYYSTDWSHPDRARVAWLTALATAGGPSHENAASRGRPLLAGEGTGIEYAWRGAREVFGLSTGAQLLIGRSFAPAPDRGFFANELRRLSPLRSGRLWIFHALDFERAHVQITRPVAQRTRQVRQLHRPGASLDVFERP